MGDFVWPKVSVIIPVYNGRKHIERCLNSITNQDYPSENFEVIVVDNGSVDGTCELVKQYPVILTSCAIKGPSAARNHGAKHASGDIFLFMDSDCLADTSLISEHVQGHMKAEHQSTGVAVIGGSITGEITNFWSLCDDFCCWNASHPKLKGRYAFSYWPTANISIRRNVFEELGGFNQELFSAEDVEFGLRVKKSGSKIYFEPAAKVRHINRDNFNDIIKRILSWASINEVHFRHNLCDRSFLPVIVEAILGVFGISLSQIYYALRARRVHVLLFTPVIIMNAAVFSFMWAKGHYKFGHINQR